jgi:hypothetical protein
MPHKKSEQNLLFQMFSLKMSFSVYFDDNLSVTHIFTKQNFRTVELATPFPLPITGLCRGWVSSGFFQP